MIDTLILMFQPNVARRERQAKNMCMATAPQLVYRTEPFLLAVTINEPYLNNLRYRWINLLHQMRGKKIIII